MEWKIWNGKIADTIYHTFHNSLLTQCLAYNRAKTLYAFLFELL